jgi:hypothetical protein
MLAPHSFHPTLLYQICASCSVTAGFLQRIKKFYMSQNSKMFFLILTCLMSKIYIGSLKRGDAGVEAAMSGTIVMFTSLVSTLSVFPSGGTSYNM